MKYLSFILIFLLMLSMGLHPVSAEVYLNRQWDEDLEDWVTAALSLYGRGVSIDRDYQNAYGLFMDLDPGPPFIIERDIAVTNILGEDDRVIDFGSFYVRTDGAGSVPFELIFMPPTSEPLMLRSYGHIHVTGTSSDRVIFKGAYGIKTGDWTSSASPGRDTYMVEFSWCNFDSVGHFGTCEAYLLDFGGGDVTLDNCQFSESGFEALSRVINYIDPYYTSRDPFWNFSMTECSFNDMSTLGRYTVYLHSVNQVKVVGNEFHDVEFFPYPPQSALVEANGCVLRDLRGNTGSGNTIDVIRMDGEVRDVDCQLQSSAEIPFLVGRIDVMADRTLSIGEGSVLKMTDVSSHPNFNVYGRMTAEGAVLTSFEDDQFGGDTDLEPEPSSIQTWGYNSGIDVHTDGSLSLSGCTVRYSQGGIDSQGDALIDGCTFQFNEGSGISCIGTGYNIFEITNSTFMDNAGSGVAFTNEFGLVQQLIVENITVVDNRRGISLNCGYTSPAEISISRSIFSGNENAGILADIGTGITGLTIERCIISGNGESGIQAEDDGGDDVPVRVESCVIAGNGYYQLSSSLRGHGAEIHSSDLEFINNTAAYNYKIGLWHDLDDGAQSRIASNIFYGNIGNGYSKDDNEIPWVGYNVFHDNDGLYELWFRTGTGSFRTVEELQSLGGIYATNEDIDPLFVAEVTGIADSVGYVEKENLSVIVHSGLDPPGSKIDQLIIRPDRSEERWFFIERSVEDTIFISGDITALAAVGDTFRIFDHHLDWASTLVDAGDTPSTNAEMDIDGDLRIIDGDGIALADVDIGADEFNPDTFTVIVLSPEEDDLWIAGEKYNIEWSAVGIDSISISYATHYDPQDIEYHEVAASVPASDGSYKWTVPDVVSAKCRILIEDITNQNQRAESGLFKIKGDELTRLDPDLEYYPFLPGRDDWDFRNVEDDMWPESWWNRFDYVNGIDPNTGREYPFYFTVPGFIEAEPDDFPDWLLFASVFGAGACYINTPFGIEYRPSAVQKWASIKEEWAGSCLGFSLSSLMAFDDKITFLASYPGVDAYDVLHALSLDDDLRQTVNGIALYQLGANFNARIDSNFAKSPDQAIAEIRSMFLEDTRDDRWLYLGYNSGSGAHAVVPWKVVRSEDFPQYDSIYVYDSNFPDDHSARIVVGVESGCWNYDNLPGWGGDSLLHLMDRASNYFEPPADFSSSSAGRDMLRTFAWGKSTGSFAGPAAGPGYVSLYNTEGTSIDIEGEMGGSIGFSGGSIYNSIPDARPVVPLTGSFHPPMEYILPEGPYDVTMTDFPGPDVSMSYFTESLIFSYARNDAVLTQTDRVNCGEVFTLVNPDAAMKTVSGELCEEIFGGERVFSLMQCVLVQGDSVTIEPPESGSLRFVNHGPQKSYKLRLRIAAASAGGIFEHSAIDLPANTSHTIVPSWDDIGTLPVKILIDTGNDGSIEDSIFVDNQYVATLLQSFAASHLGEFIEIRWSLSELDDGVKFSVERAASGEELFTPMPGLIVEAHGLDFRVVDAGIENDQAYRYRVLYELDSQSRILFETGEISTPQLPLTLFQNYPNPFNPVTTIRYFLPAKSPVTVDVFDVSGRRVDRLVDLTQSRGYHVAIWDGRNHKGQRVGAGVYFYRLKAGKHVLTRKMVLLR
ncbi:MAG: right-handed parallel beta-helix repeat-containing protein [Bacteroidales bacterium]|nr:right-handed parallel beta-helix repeat-containing protein [Candidatus Latescibacterota bacterium]